MNISHIETTGLAPDHFSPLKRNPSTVLLDMAAAAGSHFETLTPQSVHDAEALTPLIIMNKLINDTDGLAPELTFPTEIAAAAGSLLETPLPSSTPIIGTPLNAHAEVYIPSNFAINDLNNVLKELDKRAEIADAAYHKREQSRRLRGLTSQAASDILRSEARPILQEAARSRKEERRLQEIQTLSSYKETSIKEKFPEVYTKTPKRFLERVELEAELPKYLTNWHAAQIRKPQVKHPEPTAKHFGRGLTSVAIHSRIGESAVVDESKRPIYHYPTPPVDYRQFQYTPQVPDATPRGVEPWQVKNEKNLDARLKKEYKIAKEAYKTAHRSKIIGNGSVQLLQRIPNLHKVPPKYLKELYSKCSIFLRSDDYVNPEPTTLTLTNLVSQAAAIEVKAIPTHIGFVANFTEAYCNIQRLEKDKRHLPVLLAMCQSGMVCDSQELRNKFAAYLLVRRPTYRFDSFIPYTPPTSIIPYTAPSKIQYQMLVRRRKQPIPICERITKLFKEGPNFQYGTKAYFWIAQNMDLREKISTENGDMYLDGLTSMATWYLLQNSRSWLETVAIMFNHFRAFSTSPYLREIQWMLNAFIPGMEYQSDSFADTIKKMFTSASDVFTKSEIGISLANLLACFSGIGLALTMCDASTAEVFKSRVQAFSKLLLDMRSSPLETFVQKFFRFITVAAKNMYLTVKNGDLAYMFGSKIDSAEWKWTVEVMQCPEVIVDEARPPMLTLFKKKLAAGKYPAWLDEPLTRPKWLSKLQELEKTFPAIERAVEMVPEALKEYKLTHKVLVIMINTEERRLCNGGERVPPLAIFMPGLPGTGKTTFYKMVHRAVGAKLDLPVDGSSVHHVDLTQNFPVYNASQWFCLANDVDISPTVVEPNHVTFLMKALDSAPLNMEGAGLPEKGSMWFNALLLFYITNHPDAGLKGRTSAPLAFWRRFKYRIVLVPRPQYSINGVLTPSKIPAGVEDIYESITVDIMDPSLFKVTDLFGPAPYKPFKIFNNLPSFTVWFREEMVIHAEVSKQRLAENDLCVICGCSAAAHPLQVFCTPKKPTVSTSLIEERDPKGYYSPYGPPSSDSDEEKVDVEDEVVQYQAYQEEFVHVFFYMFILQQLYVLFVNNLQFVLKLVTKMSDLYKSQTNQELFGWRFALALAIHRNKTRLRLIGGATLVTATAGAAVYAINAFKPEKIEKQSTTETVVPVPNCQVSNASWKRTAYEIGRPYLKIANPTWTMSDLHVRINESMGTLSTPGGSVFVVHLKENFFLTVNHVFSTSPNGALSLFKEGDVDVTFHGSTVTLLVTEKNSRQVPGQDLRVVYIPEVIPFVALWPRIPVSPMAVDKLSADSSTLVNTTQIRNPLYFTSTRVVANVNKARYSWAYGLETVGGDCGSIGVITVGNCFTIVSLHTSFVASSGTAYGEDLSQTFLSPVIEKLRTTLLAVPPEVDYQASEYFLSKKQPVTFTEMPMKSSLWVNQSSDKPIICRLLGTIVGYHNNSFKSAVVDMPNKDLWRDLEMKYCGSNNYFKVPSGNGRMVDGVWRDPFTVSMSANSNSGGDIRIWEKACEDFVKGTEVLLSRDQVRPLSEFEAIQGLIETDISSVNMSTSVGMPFNTKKKAHLKNDFENKIVYKSPELQETFDILDAVLLSGKAPSAVCNYVLKDEPLSEAKCLANKVRVFNVFPFAYNTRLRQYLGPILIFMRRHPYFFESAAGMNVTSYQWSDLYDWLNVYDNWLAFDNASFDLKMSTNEGLAVIKVLLDIATLCHYTAEELENLRLLLFGCIYTTRVCKGDVFITSYMMGTGFWATLLFNHIRNCLQKRYCFLVLKPVDLVADFRDGIHQITLGDDNTATTIWPWFNQVAIQAVCKDFGAEITSADKTKQLTPFDSKESVTFLKRNFVRMPDGVMLAPIEVKTLIKMVTMRVKSELSMVDHCCTLYSNVLAEVWMHGEDLFNIFKEKILLIVEEHQWRSPYLVVLEYHEYKDRYSRGVLSVWDPSQNILVLDEDESKEPAPLQFQMSTNTPIDSSSLAELSGAENTMLVPAVTVTGEFNHDPTLGRGNIVSSDDVFSRDVLLRTFSISSTDTALVNLTGDYDIFHEYLSSPLVNQYLSAFRYVSCDLIVTVRLVAPGSCYGVYNVQALCDGGIRSPTSWIFDEAPNDTPYTSTQDLHTFVNVDLKNDAVFHLPWVNSVDSVTIPVSRVECWRMLIWALSPIQNTLSDTVAYGTLQVYARMGPHRNLESLQYQSKTVHKPVDERFPTKSKDRPKVSAVASKLSSGVSMLAGMFPVIAPYALPTAAGLASLSTLADAFGFTREAKPLMPEPTTLRVSSSLANYDGTDASDVCALSVANSTMIDGVPGGGESVDEMSFPSLFERWTIVDITTLTPTSTGIVNTFPVTPFLRTSTLGVSYTTIGGYCGMPFAKWRGGMEYMIYIPSSSNMQGSLQVLWDPYTLPRTSYADDPTNRLANTIIDLKGTSRTILEVGYSNPNPCMSKEFLSSGAMSLNANGQLVYYMNAPLTAPRVTGFTVQVILLARPMQDMSFGHPSASVAWGNTTKTLTDLVYQSGPSEVDSENRIVLVPSSPYPTADLMWGEEINSARALCQHFTPYLPWYSEGGEGQFMLRFPHFPPPPFYNVNSFIWNNVEDGFLQPRFSYLGWYSAFYTGVRGSTRLKVVPHSGTCTVVATPLAGGPLQLEDPTYPKDFLVPLLLNLQTVSPSSAGEFTLPYYGTKKFLQPRTLSPNADHAEDRLDFLGSPNPPASGFTGTIFAAAGPDFTVVHFRRTPGFYFR
jgi:hypothetical protein